jgi:hypothetical protein
MGQSRSTKQSLGWMLLAGREPIAAKEEPGGLCLHGICREDVQSHCIPSLCAIARSTGRVYIENLGLFA